MSKMVQRAVALVVMLVVVMGGTIWGVSSMTIHYQPLDSGAPVVMTVNGDEVCADEYAGYMLYNMAYYANMYAQFGMTDVWNDEYAAATLGSSMPQAAKDQSVYARVVLQKFNELGLKLTYDQEKQMTQLRQDTIDSMGYDAFAKQIANFGFSDQSYNNFMYISQCYNALNEYYYGENGANVPSDEDLRQYFADNYIAAKHILISTVDSTTGETIRTDEEAKAEAQKILDRINAGEDYDALMNEYSEDPGLAGNPDGYIFTEGEMVTEFYDGAKALAEDEVSGLVKSDYGYHIIKRVPLDVDGQFENYKSLLTTAVAGTMDDLLTQWMQEADVQTTETYDEITYQNVRDYLPAEVQEILNAQDAASTDDAAATDDAADAATTDGAAAADDAAAETTDAAE
ncbi:MAG TPA: peptidylprolyl isomerase [Candidatus Agathobaculum merdipullorum]|nr:peptidylprolyl isomerase [Candidatus Agathobaculum merdipullorum]